MKPCTPKQNAPQNPKAMEGVQNTGPIVPTKMHAVNVLALACTMLAKRGRISTKAKAPACRNVLGIAVAAPTDKRGLVMPEISRHGFARVGMVYGHGVAYPQGWPHGYSHVTNRHAHPLPVVRQPVASKSRIGATMHPTKGQTAPVSKAAPAIFPTSTDSASDAQAFALLEATRNASLAAFYLRKGNLAAARRKAVQLLKSIQSLEVAHA